MSSLLRGLALALGGGLRGYADWKMYDNETKRRDAMMAEETASREEARRMNRMRLRGDLASKGIFSQGEEPEPNAPVATSATMRTLAGYFGGGGGMGKLANARTPRDAEFMASPTYRPIGEGLSMDMRRTDPWMASEEREGRRREHASYANDIQSTFPSLSRAQAEVGARRPPLLGAMTKEPMDELTGAVTGADGIRYRYQGGKMVPLMGPDDKPFRMRDEGGSGHGASMDMDRERQKKIDEIVAAYNGDWKAINQAVATDPSTRKLAMEAGYTLTEIKAAINRWKASKGSGVLRFNDLSEDDDDMTTLRAQAIRKADPTISPAEAHRRATREMAESAPMP